MPSQRARDAGMRVRLQIVKWTAEGAVKCAFAQSILQRRTPVSCRGYVGTLKAHRLPMNSRWHRG